MPKLRIGLRERSSDDVDVSYGPVMWAGYGSVFQLNNRNSQGQWVRQFVFNRSQPR